MIRVMKGSGLHEYHQWNPSPESGTVQCTALCITHCRDEKTSRHATTRIKRKESGQRVAFTKPVMTNGDKKMARIPKTSGEVALLHSARKQRERAFEKSAGKTESDRKASASITNGYRGAFAQ